MSDSVVDWMGNHIRVGSKVFYSANTNNEIQLGVVEEIGPQVGRYWRKIKILRLNNKRSAGKGTSGRWTYLDRVVLAPNLEGIYEQGFQDGVKAADEINAGS